MTRTLRRRAVAALTLVLGAAGLGWLAAHLWWQWWSPAPNGIVYETTDGLQWLADPVDAGSTQLFSATAQYVLIAATLGVLLGVVVAVTTRGWEVVGLLVGLLAAVAGAYVMVSVGADLSPPDPATKLKEAGAGAELPGAMQVPGFSPHVAWPAGLLAGHLAVTLLSPRTAPTRGSSVGREPIAGDVGGGQ